MDDTVALGRTAGVKAGVETARAVAEGSGEIVALAAGEASGRTLGGISRRGEALGAWLTVGATVAVAATVAIGVVAGTVAVAVAAVAAAGTASAGFTKTREGALGGGVASPFILIRTFSAACRSPMRSQP